MEQVGWARFKKRWGNTRLRAASYWMGCHLSLPGPDIIFADAALAGVEGEDQPELVLPQYDHEVNYRLGGSLTGG
jgi:hypothetical protein